MPEDYYFSSARNYASRENEMEIVRLHFVVKLYSLRARIANPRYRIRNWSEDISVFGSKFLGELTNTYEVKDEKQK